MPVLDRPQITNHPEENFGWIAALRSEGLFSSQITVFAADGKVWESGENRGGGSYCRRIKGANRGKTGKGLGIGRLALNGLEEIYDLAQGTAKMMG